MDSPPGRPVATTSRSSHGLDGVNFFVAAVQTGFGSFLTVYLELKLPRFGGRFTA